MERKDLIIREAKPSDLLGIMYLLRQTVLEMNKRGYVHWNMAYPDYDVLSRDIEKNSLFVIKEKGYLVGVFVLNNEQVEEYKNVTWANDLTKSIIIHRMMVHPGWKGKNIEAEMLIFIEKYSKEKGYEAIRLDLAGSNLDEMNFFKANAFEEKGEFMMNYQKVPFKCFEKSIKK